MNNISDEELLALQAAHVEVTTSQWQQVRRRILIRALVVIGLVLSRALLLYLFPQTYEPLVFGSSGDLQSLIVERLWVGAGLGGIYFYALMTNSYIRSVSILALMVPVTLIWADLQMFLISSFPEFTPVVTIGFGLRLAAIYLLAMNYIDIRR
jgi:hypothetical protein